MMIYNIFNHPLDYYVYWYLRDDNTPYYVGKGKNGRAWSIAHFVELPSDCSKIQILAHRLDEYEAYTLEIKLISYYGREDISTGILQNKTACGAGVSSYWTTDRKKEVLSSSARINRVQHYPISEWQISNPIKYDSPLTDYQSAYLEFSRELALEIFRKNNPRCK
jgi:hypothetical protein